MSANQQNTYLARQETPQKWWQMQSFAHNHTLITFFNCLFAVLLPQ